MEWKEYSKKFYHLAVYNGKKEDYINRCLNYAEVLFLKGLPVIYDQNHFSLLVGYNLEYLHKVSNSSINFYRQFVIPKKSKGELRTILEPLPNLKDIQKWILDNILYQLEPSKYTKAYKKGVSIKDNAKFHRKQKKVLTIDLKNYFGTINFDDVYLFFRKSGYKNDVAILIAGLCSSVLGLPQGAPTSPMLANLITINLDKRIAAFTQKNNIRYTRYADDLTFSGDFDEGFIIKKIKEIVISEGFEINNAKTRLREQHQRQEVTGIVVNNNMQASRNYRRKLRQEIYYIKQFGLESHLEFKGNENPEKYVRKLIGKANFIKNINHSDSEVEVYLNFLKELLSKYK